MAIKKKKPVQPVKVKIRKVKPKSKGPGSLGLVRSPKNDLDPGALKLQGKPAPVAFSDAILNMALEETKAGASTLTVTLADYKGDLLRSKIIKGKVTLTWDNLPMTMVKVEKGDRQLILSFEEEAVNVLREYDKPKKATRKAGMTRAMFVRSLITEVKGPSIPYKIPEINVRQPIKASEGKA